MVEFVKDTAMFNKRIKISVFHDSAVVHHKNPVMKWSLYLNLARSDEGRERSCRKLFCYELEPGGFDRIRRATNGNFALGSNRFTKEIREILGCRVRPGKAGRPRKKPAIRK